MGEGPRLLPLLFWYVIERILSATEHPGNTYWGISCKEGAFPEGFTSAGMPWGNIRRQCNTQQHVLIYKKQKAAFHTRKTAFGYLL